MKPTAPISSHQDSSHAERTANESDFPVINCSYQSTVEALEAPVSVAEVQRAELPSFSDLSRDVFAGEAHREYIKEAIFFAGISCMAAWPVTVMIHQLATMMISPPPGGVW